MQKKKYHCRKNKHWNVPGRKRCSISNWTHPESKNFFYPKNLSLIIQQSAFWSNMSWRIKHNPLLFQVSQVCVSWNVLSEKFLARHMAFKVKLSYYGSKIITVRFGKWVAAGRYILFFTRMYATTLSRQPPLKPIRFLIWAPLSIKETVFSETEWFWAVINSDSWRESKENEWK